MLNFLLPNPYRQNLILKEEILISIYWDLKHTT